MSNPSMPRGPRSRGYVVEIDGKFDSEYESFTAALKAGFALKNKLGQSDVKVHEADELTWN